MKYLLIVLIIIIECKASEAQCSARFTSPMLRDIYHQTSKNILLWRANYAIRYLHYGMTPDYFLVGDPDLLLKILPDDSCCIALNIKPLNKNYERFQLYDISKELDMYWCPSTNRQIDFPPYDLDTKFLVGYDSLTREMLFISGHFFHSNMLGIFYMKEKSLSDSSMISYLNLVFYYRSPQRITVLKHRLRYAVFRIDYADKSYTIIRLYREYQGKKKRFLGFFR